MARRRNEIFAHNNKYEGNIFKKMGRWFGKLKGWQKGMFITFIALLIIVIGVGSFALAKLGLIDRMHVDETKLSCVDVDGYINILLLGVDSRNMENIEGSGADAIMILSIKEETGEVKLMSVYRDTYLKFGDTDTYGKITDANRYGGPAMMMQTLNQAMDLNLSKFAVVNFKAVTDLVNAVGGITIDVQEEEIEQLNKYTIQTANNVGQKDYRLVTEAGKQELEGVQAVSYGRIRKGVGDDFKRTERMRVVLNEVFKKLKTMSIGELNKLLDQMLPHVKTNLSNSDMVGLAMRLVDFNIKSGAGWPYEITGGQMNGISYVFPDDLAANTTRLHQEMFGQTDYKPSETVQNISNTIISNINSSVSNQKPIETTETTDPNEGIGKIPEPEDPVTPPNNGSGGNSGSGDNGNGGGNSGNSGSGGGNNGGSGDGGDNGGNGDGGTTPEPPVEPEPPTDPDTPSEPEV